MQLTIVALLAACLTVSANTYAQKVTIVENKVSLKKIFREIKKQTGYSFIYAKEDISRASPVTIDMRNADVQDVLKKCFAGQPLTFMIRNDIIVVKPRPARSAPPASLPPPQKELSGMVSDSATGEPLAGVTIKVKDKNTGTVTDAQGRFSLEVPDGAVLEVSHLGYIPKMISTGGASTLDILLSPSTTGLNQLVVIGYGTQEKKYITSAISSVESDEFIKGTVSGPLQLLRGKVAGIGLSSPGGDPTGGTQINIRGISTLSSSSSPLIVIDGVPGASLNAIAPEDIESIDVLKDASAAAIYGTRGSAGVIIVTTRNKKSDGMSVHYDGYLSVDRIARKLKVLDASQVRDIRKLTGLNSINTTDYGHTTDWQDEILRTPVNQVHHLGIRGSEGNSNYSASITYRTLNGILLNSDKNSLMGRLMINHSAVNDRLRFNLNISDNITNDKTVWYNAYLFALIRNPTDSVYNDKGGFTDYPTGPLNPVSALRTETASSKWNQLFTSAKMTVEPVKNWNIYVIGSLSRWDHYFTKSNNFENHATVIDQKNGVAWGGQKLNVQNSLEAYSDYYKEWNGHYFKVMGGYSYQDYTHQEHGEYAYDFPTDVFGPWNLGAANSTVDGLSEINSSKWSSTLISFYGRVNYNYKGKYLLMASLRKEGSSKFGDNYKWGFFPAVSAGWSITDEPFMENIAFLNNLKLRIGYGVTGTQPADPYLSIPMLGYGSRMYYNGSWIQGVAPTRNPNPDLRWEKKEEVNIGLDFVLFSGNLAGSIDVYQATTKDLLYNYNVPVPPNLYQTMLANVGSIRNKGVELTLNATLKQTKPLKISVNGNFSYNSNKLLNFSNDRYQLDFLNLGSTGAPVQQYTHKLVEGQPIGNFYAWKSVGVDDDGKWIIEKPDKSTTTETVESDKQVIGNGIPNMFAGLTGYISYKAFDFSLTLRGAFQFQILDQMRMMYETFARIGEANQLESVLHRPYEGKNYLTASPQYVSYYMENGDYLKLDNVTIGYAVPFTNKKIFKGLRVFISGLNIYTFTKYRGIDPEVSIKGLTPGVDDMAKYPSLTSWTLGINIDL